MNRGGAYVELAIIETIRKAEMMVVHWVFTTWLQAVAMAVVLIVLASHAAHQVLMTRLGHFMHEAIDVDIGFGSECAHILPPSGQTL